MSEDRTSPPICRICHQVENLMIHAVVAEGVNIEFEGDFDFHAFEADV